MLTADLRHRPSSALIPICAWPNQLQRVSPFGPFAFGEPTTAVWCPSPQRNGNGESRVTVGDYAAAVVDTLENGSFIRVRFTVAY